MLRSPLRMIGALLCLGLANLPVAPTLAADPVLVGAGDIAHCLSTGDTATAALLDTIAGTVFTAGDNVYPSGSTNDFRDCYDPTWGRHKARTRPAPGNHDYKTPGAVGYYGYFGAAAGDPMTGYYSYDLGTWRIIVINSNCTFIGGCQAGSPQEQWLRADLAAHPTACTLAYWHHPRFSSGPNHGSDPQMQPIWQALYDAGADVVVSGHDHDYERFAPQDPTGIADPNGIRSFVVGTGGSRLNPISTPIANSEVHNDDTFGVLKLTLHPTSYDWEFVPVAGGTFSDSGSDACVSRSSTLPTISVLDPASTTIGGPDFTLSVHGANFASDAVVRWNGTARPTTVIDSTHLTATIQAADIAKPSRVSITVSNPTFGATSNARTFSITTSTWLPLLRSGGFGDPRSPAGSSAVVRSGSDADKHFTTSNAHYTIDQTISTLTAGAPYVFSDAVNIPTTSDIFTCRL
jgi:Calcineurin-like phosphoesterase